MKIILWVIEINLRFRIRKGQSAGHEHTYKRRDTDTKDKRELADTLTGRQRLVHTLVSVDVMTHRRKRTHRMAINVST